VARKNNVTEETDERLATAFVGTGSREAFEELYYRYKDKVFNTAFRIVGEYEAARDVSHDVFLKVYVDLRAFRHKASFSSWLYRIAVNRSLDEARRVKRRRGQASGDAILESLSSGRDSDLPESRVLGREETEAVMEALDRLTPKLRTVVTLRYFEGLSYEQVADIIGRPVGTVKSRLRRAHRRLGETLGPYEKTAEDRDGLRDGKKPHA
jgi:RNA polymerase sigma-70 factor (ECF subfamily)